ncbi:MAG: 4Fe-4S binding protein [Planctomycetes bacterium]|nr:4Fe-4S binding protein [Planctomycetota bacterium]
MRKPKLRELKEAVRAVLSGPYTTKFPAEPHVPPEGFRGKPEFQEDGCIGCGACAEACPAVALRVADGMNGDRPVRRLEIRYDKCIFCGQCELNCTTKRGVKLTPEWDLATLDRASLYTRIEHELVLCEACGVAVGTGKHLRWVAEQIGAKAYGNPTLILTADGGMALAARDGGRPGEPTLARSDSMRVLCPSCRRTNVVRELWGQ